MFLMMTQINQVMNAQRRRRAWVWPRPQNWFRHLIASPGLNFMWKEHFRVTRETFEYLCDLVRVKLQKLYGIPQIIGAIDGCHIEINAPPENHEDYFNRKHHYSVNLQGIVDANLKFVHATVGYPGSIHDARVLRLSGLYDLAQNEQILSGPIRNISGTEIGPLLAGDSAYPLMNWLLKPFADRGRLTPEQRKFNLQFSALRCVVERTFGMLKSRWRIMLKKLEQKKR